MASYWILGATSVALKGESHIDFRTQSVTMTLGVEGLLLMTF